MPTDQRSYDRLWLAFVNLTTIPGLPLIYYGDEYGEYGGSDPDNRHFFRPEASLNDQEKSELARMRKLLTTRNTIKSLSRGSLEEMWCNSDAWGDPGAGGGDLMAYARPDADPKQSVVVVINLKYESWPGVTVNVPQDVGWSNGTVVDAITGHEWSLTNGSAQVDVDGRSGVVLKLK
jgi:glycosidase